jgi:hypothetical protein
MTEQNYGGRSLAYIRQLTRSDEFRLPKAASVRALAVHLAEQGRLVRGCVELADIGALLLFPDVGVHGDIALNLGDETMLIIDHRGRTHIVPADHYGDETCYVV